MATTHGYGGEFSSDEDIEKIEQKSEHFIQSKFEQHSVKPTKKQIEDAIETIKRLPIEQELQLTDELLAGLLDHYKTQRGPIVDSTRKLYKKIVLRLVRGDQNDEATKESNGNSNNNNNIEIINKRAPQQRQIADSYSSDEEDPIVPESDDVIDKRFEMNKKSQEDDNDMEVDSETPSGPIRETKQVEISTTEEESDESTDEGSSDDDSDQNLSPIKPPANQGGDEIQTVRQTESSVKQRPIAQSTPKTDSVKKPYTRSQRIAAARALAREKSPVEIKRTQASIANVTNDNNRSSRRRYVAMTVGLLVVFLAFVLFYFRSSLIRTAEPLLSRKISF